MDKIIELAIWPLYIQTRVLHWVVWQTLDTIEHVQRG